MHVLQLTLGQAEPARFPAQDDVVGLGHNGHHTRKGIRLHASTVTRTHVPDSSE